MDIKELLEFKQYAHSQVDKESIIDITSLKININLPIYDRLQNYLSFVKNPYLLKNGTTIIQLEFSEDNGSIEDRVKDYLTQASQQ